MRNNPVIKFIFDYKWILITLILTTAIVGSGYMILRNTQYSLLEGQIADYNQRAEAAIEEENYHEAYKLLQQAQEIDPANNEHYIARLGDVAFLNGDYQIATIHYQAVFGEESAEIQYYKALEQLSILKFNPTLSEISKAEQYVDEERPLSLEDLQAFKEKVRSLNDEHNQSLQQALVGKYLIEVNALTLAQDTLQNLVTEEPQYRDAHYLLGVAYLQAGNTQNAKASLNNALEIDPEYKPAKDLIAGL